MDRTYTNVSFREQRIVTLYGLESNAITLERLFNANIARLVSLLTKEHDVDYHVQANLEKYITGIKTDVNAAAIKTADRMHNMMTLNQKSFESCYRKAMETKEFYIPFFKDVERNILAMKTCSTLQRHRLNL